MNRPPMILRVGVAKGDGGFRLWLPLFILFPFLLVLLLLFTPFLLLAALLLWSFGLGRPFLLVIPVLLGILWALRGLEIDIKDRKERVFILFT